MKTINDIMDNPLTLEQCEKLPTPRLLAYYKKHRWLGGVGQCDCCGELLTKEDQEINDVANAYRDAIKVILDRREHVER